MSQTERGLWQVVDAECEPIAFCPTLAQAQMVAWALNNATDRNLNACRLHSGES